MEKNRKNKTTTATISLVLMLTIAATLITFLPIVNAADINTCASLAINPNPVGVGQQVWVSIWVSPIGPTALEVLHGYTATITKPD